MTLLQPRCCRGVQVAHEHAPAYSLLASERALCHVTAAAASSSNSGVGSDRCFISNLLACCPFAHAAPCLCLCVSCRLIMMMMMMMSFHVRDRLPGWRQLQRCAAPLAAALLLQASPASAAEVIQGPARAVDGDTLVVSPL